VSLGAIEDGHWLTHADTADGISEVKDADINETPTDNFKVIII